MLHEYVCVPALIFVTKVQKTIVSIFLSATKSELSSPVLSPADQAKVIIVVAANGVKIRFLS